jgi:hypothetical protein
MLQARKWRVRFPKSLDFTIARIFPALRSTHSLTEINVGNLHKGKGRPAHKADNLTAICEPVA